MNESAKIQEPSSIIQSSSSSSSDIENDIDMDEGTKINIVFGKAMNVHGKQSSSVDIFNDESTDILPTT